MDGPAPPITPRKRPPLGRLIATALAGGLGIFAIAPDTSPPSPHPPQSLPQGMSRGGQLPL